MGYGRFPLLINFALPFAVTSICVTNSAQLCLVWLPNLKGTGPVAMWRSKCKILRSFVLTANAVLSLFQHFTSALILSFCYVPRTTHFPPVYFCDIFKTNEVPFF
jgi:hypothetical protein